MTGPHYRFTSTADGDLAGSSADIGTRRAAVVGLPWTWLRQEHGAGVVRVDEPGGRAGSLGDALVTRVRGAAISVQVADCAPVVLLADDVVGVVHAGWRGLVAGVLPAAVDALRLLTDGPIRARVGPCIGPECYEFGSNDLETVVTAIGPAARGVTATGATALDLRAAVQTGLHLAGVDDVIDEGGCTACGGPWWSHRARGDRSRQALVAWLP